MSKIVLSNLPRNECGGAWFAAGRGVVIIDRAFLDNFSNIEKLCFVICVC